MGSGMSGFRNMFQTPRSVSAGIGKDRDRQTERLSFAVGWSSVAGRSLLVLVARVGIVRPMNDPFPCDVVIFILCNSGIVQLEVREIRCSVTGEAITDFASELFCR